MMPLEERSSGFSSGRVFPEKAPPEFLHYFNGLARDLGVYQAQLYVYRPETDELGLWSGADPVGRQLIQCNHRIPVRSKPSIVALALHEEGPVVVNKVNGNPNFLPNPLLPNTQAEAAMRISVMGAIAVLDLQSDKSDFFGRTHISALATSGERISQLLYEATVTDLHFKLQQMRDQAAQMAFSLLCLKDPESGRHTERVVNLVGLLGIACGMGADELCHIRKAALVHDIGKIGIPDDILHSPGSLTPEQWEVIKLHPDFAFTVLQQLRGLDQMELDAIRYHHERWDGNGYPQGLKGEEIPLCARILTIADVWDALVSKRPYKRALSEEEAAFVLREESGKRLDPQLVGMFLNIMISDPGLKVSLGVYSQRRYLG